jgi:trehalose-6-phosphate synthase
MPLEERKKRWSAMFERLMQQTVETWQDDFLKTLDAPPPAAVGRAKADLPVA